MKREISLEEISDGKLYGSGDMVKVGCDDCRGCSACCRGMGSSFVWRRAWACPLKSCWRRRWN